MNIVKEVLQAETRIRLYIRETYLEHSSYFSQLYGAQVYFKLENLQYTSSFKVRGAMNKLLSLTPKQRAQGVVTVSTGNHGAAVAFSLSKLGAKGIVFMRENTEPSKVEAIEQLGAEVRYFGLDTADTEAYARQYAAQHGMIYVPPYNDPQVVGGQGTIALELTRQLDQIDSVFVALGGGGLIGGIAGYFKSVHPNVQIIGCSPENSQVMIQSVQAGRILELPSLPTLSDSTAGGVEPGSITFELCRDFVDQYLTVTEEEIKKSMQLFMQTHHMLIEGAAAVALAAYLQTNHSFVGKNVVIVICGANISLTTLKEILQDNGALTQLTPL